MEDLFKKQHTGELVLVVLFIIYLIMGYKTPQPVANFISTIPGMVIVVILAIILLCSCHPILGVIGVVVAFELIRRSNRDSYDEYIPSEQNKMQELTSYNQFPYTLEQEVVKEMTVQRSAGVLSQATYKPYLEDNYDAAPI
jgi:hypothetical protein